MAVSIMSATTLNIHNEIIIAAIQERKILTTNKDINGYSNMDDLPKALELC